MYKNHKISEKKQMNLRQNKTDSLIFLFKSTTKSTTKSTHRKAFSLIELLVVILILGLLVGLVAPRVIEQGAKAQQKLACTQMASIKQALKMFKLDNGSYPATDEGIEALVANPDADKYPNYSSSPYLEKVANDSWGTPLVYIKDGSEFKIISFGSDKKEGAEDKDGKDIIFPDCQK